jgi:hypothetical protein
MAADDLCKPLRGPKPRTDRRRLPTAVAVTALVWTAVVDEPGAAEVAADPKTNAESPCGRSAASRPIRA